VIYFKFTISDIKSVNNDSVIAPVNLTAYVEKVLEIEGTAAKDTADETKVVVAANVVSNVDIAGAKCIVALKTALGRLINAELCVAQVPINVTLEGAVGEYVVEAFLLDENRSHISIKHH